MGAQLEVSLSGPSVATIKPLIAFVQDSWLLRPAGSHVGWDMGCTRDPLHDSGQNSKGFVDAPASLKFSFNPVTLKFFSILVCECEKKVRQRSTHVP